MKKISLDELINMVDSRYSLVTIISRRARQIVDGSQVLIKTDSTKPVAIAIEEFYDGAYQPIYDYEQYKKDHPKIEISQPQSLEEKNEAAVAEEVQPTDNM